MLFSDLGRSSLHPLALAPPRRSCFTLRINRKTRRPLTRADLIPTHAEPAYNTLDIVLFLSPIVLANTRDQVMLAL